MVAPVELTRCAVPRPDLLIMVDVPPLCVGQVSIAGTAIAALHKEFSSSTAGARKIIRPVKSPSPSGRTAVSRDPRESILPPFRDSEEKYQSQCGAELQLGTYAGGMERVCEDWRAQVCNAATEQHKKTC